MIHDAVMEVTCDGKRCTETVYVKMEYVYGGFMHTSGRYVDDNEKIEERLQEDHDWIVRDGNHYCSEGCASRQYSTPARTGDRHENSHP